MNFERVYQFKITLERINPPIWRRIQVPETYTFGDLHVAIQDAMGWKDYHLHEFRIKLPRTSKEVIIEMRPEESVIWGEEVFNEWEEKIKDWFLRPGKTAIYIYDFGDTWVHKIKLEKILKREESKEYPICVAGERACPPEDIGGVLWYRTMLGILKNPNHPDYKKVLERLGEDFDPEKFDPDSVKFRNPKRVRREYY